MEMQIHRTSVVGWVPDQEIEPDVLIEKAGLATFYQ
jgi:hypothetical protein